MKPEEIVLIIFGTIYFKYLVKVEDKARIWENDYTEGGI